MGKYNNAFIRFILYGFLSLFIFIIWTYNADTEGVHYQRDGKPYYSLGSIQKIADGSAEIPFVRRRLLPDAAVVISRILVRPWRDSFKFYENSPYFRFFWKKLENHGWTQENAPLLIAAYFIIGLSILGYMYACRYFALSQYEIKKPFDDIIGAIFGLSLLGGLGPWWCAYSYDIPNAFVFTVTLCGIVNKRWWFFIFFCLSVYSKETACLLIVAYVVMNREWRDGRFWVVTGILSLTFLAIRHYINLAYGFLSIDHWWLPERNFKLIIEGGIYYSWFWLLLVLVLFEIKKMWAQIPTSLRWLLLLVPIIVTAAFFKGWIEERRQYYEIVPIVGLILLQCATRETGILSPRKLKENS